VATDYDIAKMMFGWAKQEKTKAAGVRYGDTQIYTGTVVADNGDGTYQILLQSGEEITVASDIPLVVGQTVQIIKQGDTWVIYSAEAIVTEIENTYQQTQTDLATEIKKQGEEISAEILQSMSDFEEAHGLLTDPSEGGVPEALDVKKTLDEQEAYTKQTFEAIFGVEVDSESWSSLYSLTQSYLGLKAQVEKCYTNDEQGTAELKTALNIAADGIEAQISREVTNILGDGYYTKTEIDAMPDGLALKVSAAIKSGTSDYDSRITSASNAASSAQSTADDASNFISAHFTFSTSGLEISSSDSSTSLMLKSDTIMFQRNGSNAFSIEIPSSSSDPVEIRPNGTNYSKQLAILGNDAWCDLLFGSNSIVFEGSNTTALMRSGLCTSKLSYQACVSLYSGSSSGSISLSESASTFDYLQICFKDSNSNYDSVFVPAGASKVNLTMGDYLNADGAAMNTRTINISGSSITQNTGVRSYIAVSDKSVSCAAQSNHIYITNVIGWSS
jgi:hypothetical protein